MRDLETWEFYILGKIAEVNVIIKDTKYVGTVIPHSIKLYKAYKIIWIRADYRNKSHHMAGSSYHSYKFLPERIKIVSDT